MDDDKTSGTSKDKAPAGVAEAARTWVDVFIRVLIVAVVVVVLVWPSAFPVLKRFALASGKVNIMGSEFDIVEVAMFKGVTVDSGKLLLQGVDVNTFPDTVAKLTQSNSDLVTQNTDLKDQLQKTTALLDDARKKLDDANQQLATLQSQQHPVKPIDTAHLDIQMEALKQSAALLASNPTYVSAAIALTQAVTKSEDSTLPFAIVFGEPKDRAQAVKDANTAVNIPEIAGVPIAVITRGGYVRAVAGFGSREEAVKTLPKFRQTWSDAYVVDARAWCPAAVVTTAGTNGGPSEVDCKF